MFKQSLWYIRGYILINLPLSLAICANFCTNSVQHSRIVCCSYCIELLQIDTIFVALPSYFSDIKFYFSPAFSRQNTVVHTVAGVTGTDNLNSWDETVPHYLPPHPLVQENSEQVNGKNTVHIFGYHQRYCWETCRMGFVQVLLMWDGASGV